MMKKFVAASIAAVLFFLPASALAEKIVFGTTEWPPYTMMTENGHPSGLLMEIVLELCSRLKIEPVFEMLPWKRALVYTEKGRVDALLAPRRTEEREKFMYYPQESLYVERTVILARKGSAIKMTQPDDLKGKIVGVVRGYSYGPEFDKLQEIERAVCDNDEQLIKVFAKKRISLAAGTDEGAMRYLCKQAGLEVEVVYVMNETPNYVAFSKTLGERGRNLAKKFGEALRELKKEGFIEKVRSKYF